MARFVAVLAGVFLLVCVCQAADDKSLLEELREMMSDTKLEKRSFYNVLRSKDRIRVYFQTTTSCKKCAHTVRYWTNGRAQKTTTKAGVMEVDLPSPYIGQDVMIQVCEGKDENCRYAFLDKDMKDVRFSTLNENGL